MGTGRLRGTGDGRRRAEGRNGGTTARRNDGERQRSTPIGSLSRQGGSVVNRGTACSRGGAERRRSRRNQRTPEWETASRTWCSRPAPPRLRANHVFPLFCGPGVRGELRKLPWAESDPIGVLRLRSARRRMTAKAAVPSFRLPSFRCTVARPPSPVPRRPSPARIVTIIAEVAIQRGNHGRQTT